MLYLLLIYGVELVFYFNFVLFDSELVGGQVPPEESGAVHVILMIQKKIGHDLRSVSQSESLQTPLTKPIPLAAHRKPFKPLLKCQADLEPLIFAEASTLQVDIVQLVRPQT